MQAGLRKGICYLVSHKYAESQEQLVAWNKKFGFDLPLWWWDAYVHLFIAYYDGRNYLPTRYPLTCTNNIAGQANLETSKMVFESDRSILSNLTDFAKNRPTCSPLPKIITPDQIIQADKKLFESVLKQHRAGQYVYSYEKNQNASRQGCCQLYARTLIECCGVDPMGIQLPSGLSILSWGNPGKYRI